MKPVVVLAVVGVDYCFIRAWLGLLVRPIRGDVWKNLISLHSSALHSYRYQKSAPVKPVVVLVVKQVPVPDRDVGEGVPLPHYGLVEAASVGGGGHSLHQHSLQYP